MSRTRQQWTRHRAGLTMAAALVAAGCVGNDPDTTTSRPAVPTTSSPAPSSTITTLPPTTDDPQAGALYNPSLTRADVDCSQAAVGEGGKDVLLTAHYVVDGVLGAVCLGDEDPGLLATWELLATVTPPGELGRLAILAGFDSPESDTAAFVTTTGDFDGADFRMSMNLPFTDSEEPDFALTVVHEFGHILAGGIEQLDRFAEPGDCESCDNADGCYLAGAYLADWVAEFWTVEELAGDSPPSTARLRRSGPQSIPPGIPRVDARRPLPLLHHRRADCRSW